MLSVFWLIILRQVLAKIGDHPNIVFVLTDDQDVTLGSMDFMPKTRSLIGDHGVTFDNYFVNTPICCPSRAEIQTGRHMHNTKVIGNKCGGVDFRDNQEKLNVAFYAKTLGNYTNFYAGKYLNNYGSKQTGGVEYIPPGWDTWFALVGNSKYYGYSISNNGKLEKHGHDYYEDYYTDYIANKSVEFIRVMGQNKTHPFFVMLGTPSCHIPDDYAPWTEGMFSNKKAPRQPNFNQCPSPLKHPMMRGIQPMSVGDPMVDEKKDMFGSDWVAIKRWRTLQSVDVMVERLVRVVKEIGQLDNTYFLFSSDNGYHLGNFGLGYDKRQLYEEDIRVPLIVRGPGLPVGSHTSLPAMHIDLAPTILDMMGIVTPSQMDGASWLPHLLADKEGDSKPVLSWRTEMLVEYGGPNFTGSDYNVTNMDHLEVDVDENGNLFDMFAEGDHPSSNCKWFSKASTSECDPSTNTYACVRSIKNHRVPSEKNSIYCEFTNVPGVNKSGTFYTEYYDIDQDPWQLNNLALNSTVNDTAAFRQKMKALAIRLRAHMACKGAGCLDPDPPTPPPRRNISYVNKERPSVGVSMCLSVGTAATVGKSYNLTVVPCDGSAGDVSYWSEGLDTLGNPQIITDTPSLSSNNAHVCLNILGASCTAGHTIHAGPCQEDETKLRKADHFHWDKSLSAIASDLCNGFCLDVSSSNMVELSKCSDLSGWSRVLSHN